MAHLTIARRSLFLMLAVATAVLTACESQPPTGPTPKPQAGALRYVVSGIVSDETGSPISGAKVSVDFYQAAGSFSDPPASCFSLFCVLSTRTNSAGEYRVELDATEHPQFRGNIGTVRAVADAFEDNTQLLPFRMTTAVQNLRQRRVRTINAGASLTVSVEPDSSLFADLEYLSSFEYRAEVIRIVVEKAGTLVIEAQPMDAAHPAATLFFATTGNYADPEGRGPGPVSLPVQAGTYLLFIATPVGSGTSSFNVTTSLQVPGQ